MGFKGKVQLEYIWGSDGLFKLMKDIVYIDKCRERQIAETISAMTNISDVISFNIQEEWSNV